VSLPSGQQALDFRPAAIEPALLMDWEITRRLTLRSNMILAIATDLDLTAVSFGYTLGASLDIWRGLAAGLELATIYGLSYPDELGNPSPWVASGGLSYTFARSRLGALVGLGLSEDAHSLLGDITFGIYYDLLY